MIFSYYIFKKAVILVFSIVYCQSQRCNTRTIASATRLLIRSGWNECIEVYSWESCKNARFVSNILPKSRTFLGEDEEDEVDMIEDDGSVMGEEFCGKTFFMPNLGFRTSRTLGISGGKNAVPYRLFFGTYFLFLII